MNGSNLINVPNDHTELYPELFFGLVGPLGSNIDAAQESLESELRRFGYKPVLIHLTKNVEELIPEAKINGQRTYKEKIEQMNRLSMLSGKSDFLARVAIMLIGANRNTLNKDLDVPETRKGDFQAPKTAYIIRQLKRKPEVVTLQKIYGKKFIQISIAVNESEQWQSVLSIIGREQPELSQSDRETAARNLISRDKQESGVDFGQNTLNVHHSGDVFVSGSASDISKQLSRFMDAFFGSNYVSPTKDEFGSQLAKTASMRSVDLSRQVGAAIMSPEGDIITMGCNEVPSPLGGNYWGEDENPMRDIERGVEPNKLETTRLIHDFVHALSRLDGIKIDPNAVLKDPNLNKVLKDAFISDITEYGRITHAEMSALADAARLGRSTKGATIYVTTFPCHNCAKHLIAAGIKRIVYIEPYQKSKAMELSADALSTSKSDLKKVILDHFIGIAPKRYRDIFEKPDKRRDDDNKIKKWHFDGPTPMLEDKAGTHIQLERQIHKGFLDLIDIIKIRIKDEP